MLHWTTVMHVGATDELHNFWSIHTQEELAQQRNIAWTPSKELRRALVHFLGLVRPKVHSTAQVIIRIDLSDIPVPCDPFTWAPDPHGADFTTTTNIAHMFHKETIFSLGQDVTLTWPRRLMVEGHVEVPLWCSMASNSAEVRSSRRKWDDGEAERIVPPKYKESVEKLRVRFDYEEADATIATDNVAKPVQSTQGVGCSDKHPALTPPVNGYPFLLLPREMRDRIYDHAFNTASVWKRNAESLPVPDSELTYEEPDAFFEGAPLSSLLRVNRQINHEYTEHSRPTDKLLVTLEAADFSALSGLELKTGVPNGALSKTKRVGISVHWLSVMILGCDNKMDNFWTMRGQNLSVDQSDMAWTPSKELRARLCTFVSSIRPFVHPEAKVVIRIDLSDLTSLQDPYSWRGFNNSKQAVQMVLEAFHTETLLGMENDSTLVWPQPGKLRVAWCLISPLWCSVAKNSVALSPNYRAWQDDDTVEILEPLYEESPGSVMWRLRPTKDAGNWNGFEVVGWAMCGSDWGRDALRQ
ncbi:hypothetical protein LTR10_009274 [Elasticomyces elasticus]|nr:hypothetical protein LTR10_009274 [Elasticomyces elasticus]